MTDSSVKPNFHDGRSPDVNGLRGRLPIRPWLLAGFASLSALASAAQAQTDPNAAIQDLPAPNPPITQGSDVPSRQADQSQAAKTEGQHLKELNKLALKGWVTAAPTFNDTLTQDAGGWRSKLAEAGIGVSIYGLNLMSYDLARAGRGLPGGQLYNGQKLTYQTGNQSAIFTYDLGHLTSSLNGGQLAVLLGLTTNGYQARDGLRRFRVKGVSWYQPLFGDKAEVKFGLVANQTEFMGSTVGGDLAGGALGPLASIPVESGISYNQYSSPSFSVRVNWSKHLYTRTAVQRSLSPQGSVAEDAANPVGLTFSVHGAKPLFIQEIGYRIDPAPGVKSFWARGDYAYNLSDFTSFEDGSERHNHFVYAAVDRQLTQPDPDNPGGGIYVGATYTAAPGEVDLIDRYYEVRAYMRGPFASRPNDMISLVAAINGYSEDGRAAGMKGDFRPFSTTQSYTGSYKFQVTHGLYVQPGLSIIVHPVYNQNIGTAVNGLLNVAVFL